jgi:hypothetical protein
MPTTTLLRVLSLVLACIGLAGYALWLGSGVLVKEGNWVAVDFHVYYSVARVLSQGRDIYTAGISPPYVYPPFLGIIVLPLSGLSANTATIIWKIGQHICLLAAGGLLVSLLPRGVRLISTGLLFLTLLLVPIQYEVLLGESNSLVLVLIAACLWVTSRAVAKETWLPTSQQAKDKNTPASSQGDTLMAVAGMMLAIAASIKVLPLILVAYFWLRGPQRVALSATVGFVALQLASLAVTPSTLRYWFVEFSALFGQAFPFLDNQSFNAAISRAFIPTDPTLPNMQLASGDFLRSLLTWLANLLALLALFLVLRSASPPSTAKDAPTYRVRLLLETGLILITIHLVSGSTWLHHLVDLCIPLCGIAGAWWLQQGQGTTTSGKRYTPVIIATALAISFFLLLRRPEDWLASFNGLATINPLIALAISNSALWAVLALWAVTALASKDGARALPQPKDVALSLGSEL